MAATRFVIDEVRDVDDFPPRGRIATVAARASRMARWLSWLEVIAIMPGPVRALGLWLAMPVLIFFAVPMVLFAVLFALQAPVFYVLWKLFAERSLVEVESQARDGVGESDDGWRS